MRLQVQTFAGQVPKRETGPGRIGFMSTQKRASRSPRATGCCRDGWFRRQCTSCTERVEGRGRSVFPSPARFGCAAAGGGTAPLWSIIWSIGVWVATNFLQADLAIGQRVPLLLTADRRVSPTHFPRIGAPGVTNSPRSSLPPIPFPSGLTRLHWTLPQAPAADQRRAERYDGKRDLYLLHAA